MLWIGILFGLVAAAAQSVSYVYSRQFIVLGRGGPFTLLVLAHVLMSLASVALLPLLWDERVADFGAYGWSLVGAAGFYMIGQGSLFVALRIADASRISPLLGLKVVMVALLWVGLLGEPITPSQWMAVGLSVLAAFILNYTGGKLPLPAVAAMLLTTLTYALSDLYIIELIETVGEPGTFPAAARAAALCYILCGVFAVALLPWHGTRRPAATAAAAPYAASWYLSMFAFFTTLTMAGPVLGNIVLATRGLWSIAIGAVLARGGHHHLERHVASGVLVRRAAAAVLMIAAIGLYWW